MWTREFSSQHYNSPTQYHKDLPLIKTREFCFYRCLNFKDAYYGKTVSELHSGNLRFPAEDSRYAKLFPNQRLSYWSGDPQTAIQEVRKHGGNKNYILFWAYDDAASAFPTTRYDDMLIVDGRINGIGKIIGDFEESQTITAKDALLIQEIMAYKPDAVAYNSVVTGRENFIFFESGFEKLSLREVKLYLGERPARNKVRVACAVTSDYSPVCASYGYSFEPVARTEYHKEYLDSVEYQRRNACYEDDCKKWRKQNA